MKGKRGFVYSIVILLLAIVLSEGIYAQTLSECNKNGGIWCGPNPGGKCIGGYNPGPVISNDQCTVEISQNVTLSSGSQTFNKNYPKQFEFTTFNVPLGVELRFFNAEYANALKAQDATCADENKEKTWDSYPSALSPRSKNSYANTLGGKGGNGGTESNSGDDPWGGAGGSGAGGGDIGYAGGDGYIGLDKYSGGAGSKPWFASGDTGDEGGACSGDNSVQYRTLSQMTGYMYGGYNGGRAGGVVSINATTITINGKISVDGEKGDDGSPGRENNDGANRGGLGGGPGAGGGGAGKILLVYQTLSGAGELSAIGGNGGNGGKGGNGNNNADAGGGGGGGAGAGGVIGFIPRADTATNSFEGQGIQKCEGGLGGAPGDAYGGAPKDKSAKYGENGTNGFCNGVSELAPTGGGDPLNLRCNDGIDNEGDNLIDMNDPDCYTHTDWDGSIWEEYDQKPNSYGPSLKNSKDLVCGDDIGVCKLDTNFQSWCKPKNTADLYSYCEAKEQEEYFNSPPKQILFPNGTYVTAYGGCSNYGNMDPYIDYEYPYYPYCTIYQHYYWYDDIDGQLPEIYPEGTKEYCAYDEQMQTYKCTTYNVYGCWANYSFACSDFKSSKAECDKVQGLCYWQDQPTCGNLWSRSECEAAADEGCYWESLPSGTADLGGLTHDNKSLCLDSWGINGEVSPPGKDYAWFGADGSVKTVPDMYSEYLILQADQTHYISNGQEWFQCAANISTASGNKIKEYGTFMGKSTSGMYSCADTVEEVMRKIWVDEEMQVNSCEGLAGSCDSSCEGDSSCAGWCAPDAEYERGEFTESCEYSCNIKIENQVIPLHLYNGLDFDDAFCEINRFEPGCFLGFGGGNSSSGIDYRDQVYCKNNQELCGRGNIDSSSKTCRELHEATGYSYSTDSDKICTQEYYCDGGYLVQTSDSNTTEKKYCCYGNDAYCKEFDISNCEDVGGEIKPDSCDTCGCTGIEKGADSNCCVGGNWIDLSVVNLNPNESFICYNEEGNSLIRECCGIAGCNNGYEENPLNGWSSLSGTVYSMDGVPLHSLVNFDRHYPGLDVPDTNVRTYYERSTGDILNYLDLDYVQRSNSVNGYHTSWDGFSYLEFDIMYNNADVGYVLLIKNESNSICYYNISDYIAVRKGPLRFQHVAVDIKQMKSCNSSLTSFGNVRDINILIVGPQKEGINVLVDNFFLRSSGTSVNSKNMFCSGNWGDWVENLDGPNVNDDSGFYGESPELLEYGPYRDACEGVISFGWTGTVCCGDDTKSNNYGEFWVDTKGICWNGTTVENDMTVADALGLSPLLVGWEEAMNERSLLFYKGELLSCNRSKDYYNSYYVSFNGTPLTERLIDNMEVIPFYTIRGDWFCDEGRGWVNINEVSKVRLLAATLRTIAQARGGDYTLMCGKFVDTVNTFGTMTEENKPLTDYSCVLRMGDNKFEGNEEVIVGLETVGLYETYKNEVLHKYTLLNINQGTDKCAELPSDVDSDEFFTHCATDEGTDFENFYIYYNAPLGLMMVSLGKINAPNVENSGFIAFLEGVWTSFKNFFVKLFGAKDAQPNTLYGFDEEKFSRDFYISVQNGRTIMGFIEETQNVSLRVDYININSNVTLLYDALVNNYPNAFISYSSRGANQSIYVTALSESNVDWRLITSILRLNPCEDCVPRQFGTVNINNGVNINSFSSCTADDGNCPSGCSYPADTDCNQCSTGSECPTATVPGQIATCTGTPTRCGFTSSPSTDCDSGDNLCPADCSYPSDSDCDECNIPADCPTGSPDQTRTCTGTPKRCGLESASPPTCIPGDNSCPSGCTYAEGDTDCSTGSKDTQGFVVSYANTDITKIPVCWINEAKKNLNITYSHASHGSQLITGMDVIESSYSTSTSLDFMRGNDWTTWDQSKLNMREYQGWGGSEMFPGAFLSSDLSHTIYTWADLTRDYLDGISSEGQKGKNTNVIVWSWCGTTFGTGSTAKEITVQELQTYYLNEMDNLINEYNGVNKRKVTFVLMTIHVGGSNQLNSAIRNWCNAHEDTCILYDFADIEEHDPSGASYTDRGITASLRYTCNGGLNCNWASDYLDSHTNLNTLLSQELIERFDSDNAICAHSPEASGTPLVIKAGESSDSVLNCVLKGQAAWYLWARIAGWDGNPESTCS